MIYSVNFYDLTERINPFSFSQYLKDTGWNLFPTKKDYIRIFQTAAVDGELFQVTIPMDKKLSDYKNAMYQAIETVAFVEGQSMESLMLFLLNPNTDILKIRFDRKDIEAGNIFFDDAIRIYENTKKLFVAAAQDIIHPKRYHQGRVEDSISQFINNCRFGQTEIGSYVVSVICPFADLDDKEGYRQLSIFSDEEQCADSFTRKVTNRIMTNMSFIKRRIDNDDLEGLLSQEESSLISINFYEALTGLNLDAKSADVEFLAQWSPAVKKNRSETSNVILSHDYYQPITEVISKLRKVPNTKTKIVGKIKKLESVPEVSRRNSGKITVVYLDDNEKKKTVTASLIKEDYDRAIRAHSSGSYVELIGEITNNGSRSVSLHCEAFNIIE